MSHFWVWISRSGQGIACALFMLCCSLLSYRCHTLSSNSCQSFVTHCTHCFKPVLYSQSCGVWRFQIQMTKGEWYSSNLCHTDCTHHVKPPSLKLAITKISSSLLDHLSVTLNFPDTWAAFGHWNWSHSTKAEQWWVFFFLIFLFTAI